ncbi:short-chain dehydrogenase [Pseudalkalibacillus caeni]|uniref:Short-chain dehydrogenase n=1 Tax=Exobacillus caeni TaxID=2574798 RepID=A0A5R9EXC0_9BACL|nr:short-chain dehydrogenase [Pseudalkalibacillus caeni]TLS35727.1 short-chain dehydrogenase [Pseudalkalibacillus caeni]
MKKHALVVGGTGMLASVAGWLKEQGYHVSVVARTEASLQRLEETYGRQHLVTIQVDYHNSEALCARIKDAIKEHGPISKVVCWIHSSAPEALQNVAEEVGAYGEEWDLFHVNGSAGYMNRDKIKVPSNCKYHQVLLGFVLEDGRSRWLTNKEIADGVIEAFCTEKDSFIVGTLEPWEKRPQ